MPWDIFIDLASQNVVVLESPAYCVRLTETMLYLNASQGTDLGWHTHKPALNRANEAAVKSWWRYKLLHEDGIMEIRVSWCLMTSLHQTSSRRWKKNKWRTVNHTRTLIVPGCGFRTSANFYSRLAFITGTWIKIEECYKIPASFEPPQRVSIQPTISFCTLLKTFMNTLFVLLLFCANLSYPANFDAVGLMDTALVFV